MKSFKLAVICIVLSAIVTLSILLATQNATPQNKDLLPKFFVGVEIGWNANVTQCQAVIDQVKSYTNMIILASPTLSISAEALNETCDYAYQAGLYIMVYFSMQFFPDNSSAIPAANLNETTYTNVSYHPFLWMMGAKQRYGSHFLGVYFNDEPGGQVLDSIIQLSNDQQTNYTQLAHEFINYNSQRMNTLLPIAHYIGTDMFTSDYGLYWFDYEAGFDTVLTQFGWNNSRTIQIALTRGAANVQGKNWGAIITWTYDKPPYLEDSAQLYQDLTLAYESGAKYTAVYDSSANYTDSTLTTEHFNALRDFWNHIQGNPEKQGAFKAEAAILLPADYGFGFRSTNDSVWGVKPDNMTSEVFTGVQIQINKYGSLVDIVYNDAAYNSTIRKEYSKMIDFNGNPA
jgi:hypothetical protein